MKEYFIAEEGTGTELSVPPTATESEIGEMSQGNGGVEAKVGETVLSVVVEEVEIVVGEEAPEVVCDVQQFESVMVAATFEGKLEVKSDGCRCVEVVRWRQQRYQVGKVAGEFVFVRSSRSPPLYRLSYFQSLVKSLSGMMMRVRFF